MTRAPLFVPFAFGLGLACSSGKSGSPSDGGGGGGAATLDCAWLAGDNCWKATVDDVVSCLPPGTESGVLSADNRTCTYPSGAVVTFAPPIVFPIPDNPTWNFTIATGGQDCLHFESTALTFKLVVAGQTVTETRQGIGVSVTCPDGARFAAADSTPLFACDADGGANAGNLPGTGWGFSDTNVSFSLLGTATGDVLLFNCNK
jgi:hypothetical protein